MKALKVMSTIIVLLWITLCVLLAYMGKLVDNWYIMFFTGIYAACKIRISYLLAKPDDITGDIQQISHIDHPAARYN